LGLQGTLVRTFDRCDVEDVRYLQSIIELTSHALFSVCPLAFDGSVYKALVPITIRSELQLSSLLLHCSGHGTSQTFCLTDAPLSHGLIATTKLSFAAGPT
jgi:hypothetical protein